MGRFFPERVSGCVTGGVDPETWVYGEWEGRALRAMWGCPPKPNTETGERGGEGLGSERKGVWGERV